MEKFTCLAPAPGGNSPIASPHIVQTQTRKRAMIRDTIGIERKRGQTELEVKSELNNVNNDEYQCTRRKVSEVQPQGQDDAETKAKLNMVLHMLGSSESTSKVFLLSFY